MAIIKPFKALRPRSDLTGRVAALPYDVFDAAEAYEAVKGDSYTFLRIDRPETGFPAGHDMYADEVYEYADSLLRKETEEGIFVRDEKPCLYIYELTQNGRTQTGVAACSMVDDYLNGVVKKHENTRKEKERDRTRHVDVCSAQTGPIFLAYRPDEEIKKLTSAIKETECEADFVSAEGVRQRIWKISGEDLIMRICAAFERVGNTYIADGHHRAASAVSVSIARRKKYPEYTGEEEFNGFLSVLFPSDELKILSYNRVVKDLNGSTPEELLKKMAEKFIIKRIVTGDPNPVKKGEICAFLGGCWYRMTERTEFISPDPVEGLDVAFLQREVLSEYLDITDPTADKRIDFVGGIKGTAELERRCREDAVCAFAMYPTSIEELFAVADEGRQMPPKSTWFEPKLYSGLFIHEIER